MRDCTVVHPGVQHSGLAARALDRQNRLRTILTRLQLGEEPGWLWRQAIRSRLVGRMLDRRLIAGLPDRHVTRVAPYGELHRLLRANKQDQTVQYLSEKFQLSAVRRIPSETRHLLLTDGGALHILRGTADAGLHRVLDVAHPPPQTIMEVIAEDMDQYGFAATDYDDHRYTGRCLEDRASAEFQLADRIVVASSYTAQCVVRQAPGANISLVPYGFPAPPPRLREKRTPGPLRLLFVGATSERKGVTLLARAMQRLLAEKLAVRLDVVGSAVPGARQPQWPANVIVHGSVSRSALTVLFRAADYLVLPSICEGFGRVIVEALALGCGVVATERSVAPDLLRLFPSAPVSVCPVAARDRLNEPLAALSRCLSDDDVQARRSQAVEVAEHYSEQRYGEALDRVLS
jgi:glycosyltransferase involved in cell wall biosynthesis